MFGYSCRSSRLAAGRELLACISHSPCENHCDALAVRPSSGRVGDGRTQADSVATAGRRLKRLVLKLSALEVQVRASQPLGFTERAGIRNSEVAPYRKYVRESPEKARRAHWVILGDRVPALQSVSPGSTHRPGLGRAADARGADRDSLEPRERSQGRFRPLRFAAEASIAQSVGLHVERINQRSIPDSRLRSAAKSFSLLPR